MKNDNTTKQVTWEQIEALISDDKYKSFLKEIDPSVFKLVLDESKRPQVTESILMMLQNRDAANATEEYAEEIVNLMQKVASKVIKNDSTDYSQFAVSTYNKIADTYTKQYFNDLTDRPYIDKFLESLPAGAHVLDIGCGPGTFAQYLFKKGFDVKGIDLSKEMIRIAKNKLPNIHFELADMRHLNYPDNAFDGLLVAYSLIHIASKEIPPTLKGFNRILKPSGFIMIIAQGGEPDKIVEEPLKEGEKIFINFFTKDRLKGFLLDAGFDLIYQEELPMQDTDSLSDKVIYTIAKKA